MMQLAVICDFVRSKDTEGLRHYCQTEKCSVDLTEALKLACSQACSELVDILIDYGAKPNYTDENSSSSKPILDIATNAKAEDVIVTLIRRGTDFEIWKRNGETLLLWACHHGHVKVIKELVERDVVFNEFDSYGRGGLHLACFYGQLEVVQYLLENDDIPEVSTDNIDQNNFTPLHYAASAKNKHQKEIIELILSQPETDILAKTTDGRTVLDCAYRSGSEDIINLLVDKMELNDLLSATELTDSLINTSLNKEDREHFSVNQVITNVYTDVVESSNTDQTTLLIWKKIFQNDNAEMLEKFLNSSNYDSKITVHNMKDIFLECYENGLGVYSFIESKFEEEIKSSNFHDIMAILTRLNGFKALSEDNITLFASPFESWVFLALITGRFKLLELLLRMRQYDIIPLGLLVTLILRKIKDDMFFNEQSQAALGKFAELTETIVVEALTVIYNADLSMEKEVTINMLQTKLETFGDVSLVKLATMAKCTRFVCHPSCQIVLNYQWFGYIYPNQGTSLTIIQLCPILLLIYIFFNRRYQSSTCEDKKQYVMALLSKPSLKFFNHSLFHFIFLGFFSYVVVYDFQFSISLIEVICILYVVGYAVDELREFYFTKLTTKQYFLDIRNWIDIIALLVTTVGFVMQFSVIKLNSSNDYSEAYDLFLYRIRIVLLTGALIFYIRSLFVLLSSPILGPKLSMIGNMLKNDLLPLLFIFIVFMMGFGVVFQGLLYPNGFSNINTTLGPAEIANLIYERAFYGMFNAEYVKENSEASPTGSMGKGLVYTFNMFYFFIVNIVLINLVIALFSNTVMRIDQNSTNLWLANRHEMIEEYKRHSFLPPPFNLASIIIELIWCSCCKIKQCCGGAKKYSSAMQMDNFDNSKLVEGSTSSKYGQRYSLELKSKALRFFVMQAFGLKSKRRSLGNPLSKTELLEKQLEIITEQLKILASKKD